MAEHDATPNHEQTPDDLQQILGYQGAIDEREEVR